MNLYHLSEDPRIERFIPRPIRNQEAWSSLPAAAVWAVSAEMVHNYYFPRNCPRVCRMIWPQTNPADILHFRSWAPDASCRSIIFVETAWKAVLSRTVLYRYQFSPHNFILVDEAAGYYISEQEERPLARQKIKNLPEQLAERGVLLQFVPDLEPFGAENAASSYRFSNIRMGLRDKGPSLQK